MWTQNPIQFFFFYKKIPIFIRSHLFAVNALKHFNAPIERSNLYFCKSSENSVTSTGRTTINENAYCDINETWIDLQRFGSSLLRCQMDPDTKGEQLPVVSCDHSQEKDSNTNDHAAHSGSSRGSS